MADDHHGVRIRVSNCAGIRVDPADPLRSEYVVQRVRRPLLHHYRIACATCTLYRVGPVVRLGQIHRRHLYLRKTPRCAAMLHVLVVRSPDLADAVRSGVSFVTIKITDGKIRVESGKLIDLSAGPMFIENSNMVVIDRKGFLSLYRRDKEKIAHYLSYAGLKIHQEEFLDRLANNEPLKFITKNSHPTTNKTKHKTIPTCLAGSKSS